MSDPWQPRLSDYLDGELPASEVTELEAHLQACTACRSSLAELRTVVTRLGSDPLTLADQPSAREWEAIRRAVQPARRRWLVPSALAASLAALAVLGGLLLRQGDTGVPGVAPVPAAYDQASLDLERILREHQDQLRPETVTALKASVAAIDTAIAKAEQALAADPANDYVTRSIDRLRTARLTLLRHALDVAFLRS